ncbi:hypothetical protein G7K_3875-t1 [Saitoella complicata NRRL Y-17804]|uniref:Uncharacterized protein n=1 Tax=Saitoella complicata (strain BCRC 22490 / CBS 7301 / JCM 7358 / NBRC 10748 / NRRL Y-17804) TaxID=698492 RepID=A0A0E9NIN5_SAICN|nr:hypothetical protein G7K_3875-t1 [Saitoella complicata NRRL Y-17804]
MCGDATAVAAEVDVILEHWRSRVRTVYFWRTKQGKGVPLQLLIEELYGSLVRMSAQLDIDEPIGQGIMDDGNLYGRSDPPAAPTASMVQKTVSACAGALLTSLLVTPLDVVKTRLQSQSQQPNNAAKNGHTDCPPRPSPYASSARSISRITTSRLIIPSELGVTSCCREVFFFPTPHSPSLSALHCPMFAGDLCASLEGVESDVGHGDSGECDLFCWIRYVEDEGISDGCKGGVLRSSTVWRHGESARSNSNLATGAFQDTATGNIIDSIGNDLTLHPSPNRHKNHGSLPRPPLPLARSFTHSLA